MVAAESNASAVALEMAVKKAQHEAEKVRGNDSTKEIKEQMAQLTAQQQAVIRSEASEQQQRKKLFDSSSDEEDVQVAQRGRAVSSVRSQQRTRVRRRQWTRLGGGVKQGLLQSQRAVQRMEVLEANCRIH